MKSQELAGALRQAVLQGGFDCIPDPWQPGSPAAPFPSLDLAVVVFPPLGEAVCANLLFSREHPQGVVADIGPGASAVTNIEYLSDLRDEAGTSLAWLPGADWQALPWQTLAGGGGYRFVAPYPASLVKLMIAVGVAEALERRGLGEDVAWLHAGCDRTVQRWATDMIAISCNASTDALVAWLHAHDGVDPLHAAFARWGLHTLRLDGTTPAGGWRNADGAGVGRLQMTAWDTVRLLWLLDERAPSPPWLPAGAGPAPGVAARVRRWLSRQARHEVLSSVSLQGVPGWRPGIAGDARFDHKTGTTDNYASDAGIVEADGARARHYLIALISSLGRRYAPHPRCATAWAVPALGAAVDAWIAQHAQPVTG